MTKDEAIRLKSFEHGCNCGGYAYQMNGRDPYDPHMNWCPQRQQYLEWYQALHGSSQPSGDKT